MKFDLVKTNIVNVSADAIVLPANEKLKEGSGLLLQSLRLLEESS